MSQETNQNNALGNGQNPNSLGIHASVSFGKPDGGGPCLGKGVCKLQSVEPTAIDVKFHLSNVDKEILMIMFSLSDLTANQPDQVPFFTDKSKTYQFDAEFKLDDAIFKDLGFLPGARISPQSPTEVVIMNDIVITVIRYDHN